MSNDDFQCRPFHSAAAGDVIRVVNSYLAGWPYVRAIDAKLVRHWTTLGEVFQPRNALLGYRSGGPAAFLHAEAERDTTTYNVHLLALAPGATDEGLRLLEIIEQRARDEGAKLLRGPYHRSAMFYGGYICGREPYHPDWAVDATHAYVRAGFRIVHAGVLMVLDGEKPPRPQHAPRNHETSPREAPAEYDATAVGFGVTLDGSDVAKCSARLYPSLLDSRGRPTGQVGPVSTSEPHRGKGIAKALVHAASSRLRDLGAGDILIATGLENYPALRAYERVGFERRYNINEWSKDLIPIRE